MKKKNGKKHVKTPPKKAHIRRYGKEFNNIATTIGVIAILFIVIPLIAAIATRVDNTDTTEVQNDTEVVEVIETEDNAESEVTTTSDSDSSDNEWMSTFLEQADTYNEDMTSENGEIAGTNLKSVKEYRTLAEAQEDMGFGLGFTNTMKCYTYTLVRMFSIGDGAWYQADFEDESGTYVDLTVKVSANTSIEQLIIPYNIENYEFKQAENINGIDVNFVGDSIACSSVAYFSVAGKNYSLYNPDIAYSVMKQIVEECINNNI